MIVCCYTITGTHRIKVVIGKIRTKKDSHKSVRIFVGSIEMNVRNSISNTSCTSSGEMEMVMVVTAVVIVVRVEMQFIVC